MIASVGECYRFDTYRLDAECRLLYREDAVVPITPKALETLLVLVRSRGRLVTKDELLREVWPDSFVEENSLTQNIWLLRKALGPGPSGQSPIETLPKRGYRFVPEVTLEAPAVVQPATVEPIAPVRFPKSLYLAIALVVPLAAASFYVVRRPGVVSSRRSVAVVNFKNLSGRPEVAWISTALSEMLTAELAAGGRLRTISGESVARARTDLALPDADSFAPETLAKIRGRINCDVVVSGSFLPSGGKIRVDAQLQDAASGEIIGVISRTGEESDLLGLVAGAGSSLRERLGIAAPTASDQETLRALVSGNPAAMRLYSEGLAHLRLLDAPAAEELLTRAVAADPQFPLSHAALSLAWSLLGFDQKAIAEARQAFELSGRLPREQRLLVEGHYHQARSDWPKAIDVYHVLWSFFPDNAEYGLLLAGAQTAGGEARQAVRVVDELHRLHSAAGDTRVEVAEAAAAEALADSQHCVDAARRGANTAQLQGARLLEARARIEEGACLFHLTEPSRAGPSYQAARQICTAVGDQACVAETMSLEGSLLRSRGNFDGAMQLFEDALAIEQRIGDRRGAGRSLTSMATVLRSRADLAGAGKLFQQALDISRETGDKRAATLALINIGNILNNTGNPGAARLRYQEALGLARETGDRNHISIAIGNLAILSYSHGDLEGGRKGLEEALELKQQIGDRSSYAYSLAHLGNVLMAQGDLAGARKVWQEQSRILIATGEKLSLADCRVGLAELDVLEGRPAAAVAPAREVASQYTTPNPAADAWRVLALSYLGTGDLKQAEDAVIHATDTAAKSINVENYRLPVSIVRARVEHACGRTAQARAILADTLAQANRLTLVGLSLEARLVFCEISHNLQELRTLQQDAQKLGYGLVARQAALLAKSR